MLELIKTETNLVNVELKKQYNRMTTIDRTIKKSMLEVAKICADVINHQTYAEDFANAEDCAKKLFNISKSYFSILHQIGTEFINPSKSTETVFCTEKEDFNISQLQRLLKLKEDTSLDTDGMQLADVVKFYMESDKISFNMTIKELEKAIKTILNEVEETEETETEETEDTEVEEDTSINEVIRALEDFVTNIPVYKAFKTDTEYLTDEEKRKINKLLETIKTQL